MCLLSHYVLHGHDNNSILTVTFCALLFLFLVPVKLNINRPNTLVPHAV